MSAVLQVTELQKFKIKNNTNNNNKNNMFKTLQTSIRIYVTETVQLLFFWPTYFVSSQNKKMGIFI